MRQNQKHGQGRLTSEDGTVCEGQWVADRFEGHGVIVHNVITQIASFHETDFRAKLLLCCRTATGTRAG